MRYRQNWMAATGFLFASGLLSASGTAPVAKRPHLKREAVLDALGIPPTMADVKGGYFPRGQRLLHYVLIEDVHTLPEAQGKIAAILLYAHHHWGSRQAFVEGAFGPIGPPPFPIFTAERGELSANELLRRGLFSGGELAAALTSESRPGRSAPFEVIGMDEPALYRRQLETVEELSFLRDRALRRLDDLPQPQGPQETGRLRRLLELRLSAADCYMDDRTPRARVSDPLLAHAIQLGETYYHLTNLRSRYFAQRTSERVGRGPCLLVMGGFHTPVVARILRARGESYIVLTPHLSQNNARFYYQGALLKSLEALRRFPPGSPYTSPVRFLRLTLAHEE